MLKCQYRSLKKKWEYTTRQHLSKGLQKEVQQKGDTNQEIKALSYSQPAKVKCLMVPLSPLGAGRSGSTWDGAAMDVTRQKVLLT